MYKKNKVTQTSIIINQSTEGESIEQKLRRIINNKEPITDGAPIVYTERKDGVQPGYDIRTDRWEVAIDGMDKVSKSHKAKREQRHKKTEEGSEETGKKAQEGMKKESEN